MHVALWGICFWVKQISKGLYQFTLSASLIAQMVKNLLQCKRSKLYPWVWKIPWRKGWLPIPVFFPGEFHEQGSLAGYSPSGQKELDTTEHLTSHFSCV